MRATLASSLSGAGGFHSAATPRSAWQARGAFAPPARTRPRPPLQPPPPPGPGAGRARATPPGTGRIRQGSETMRVDRCARSHIPAVRSRTTGCANVSVQVSSARALNSSPDARAPRSFCMAGTRGASEPKAVKGRPSCLVRARTSRRTRTTLMDVTYTIEKLDTTDLGPCSCCGGRTRIVRGLAFNDGVARAAYVVRWAPGRPQHPALVALSIGTWGGSPPTGRSCFVFERSATEFIVRDGATSPFASHKILGHLLSKAEVEQSPQLQEAHTLLSVIGSLDDRIKNWRIS